MCGDLNEYFRIKLKMFHLLWISVIYILILDYTNADYESTWNFYYEQPCCLNINSHRHLRHRKGTVIGYLDM